MDPINNEAVQSKPIANVPVQSTSAMPPQSNKKSPLVLIIIIVILLVAGIGFAAYKGKTNTADNTMNTTQKTAISPAMSADFTLPTGFTSETKTDDPDLPGTIYTILYQQKVVFILTLSPSTYKDYGATFSEGYNYEHYKLSDTQMTIGGEPAQVYISVDSDPVIERILLIPSNLARLSVSDPTYVGVTEAQIDGILNSIKFQ